MKAGSLEKDQVHLFLLCEYFDSTNRYAALVSQADHINLLCSKIPSDFSVTVEVYKMERVETKQEVPKK